MQENPKIERVLESGKGLKQVDPNPYLFNKVLLKLKDRASDTYQANPVLAWIGMSVLTLLIAINIYVLTQKQSVSAESDLNSLVDVYGLNNQGGLNYE